MVALLFGMPALYYFVLPTLLRAASHKPEAPCIRNLEMIDGAKQHWAIEHKKSINDVPTVEDLEPYVVGGLYHTMPKCPEGGRYIFGRVGELPRCSIGGERHTLN